MAIFYSGLEIYQTVFWSDPLAGEMSSSAVLFPAHKNEIHDNFCLNMLLIWHWLGL